MAHTKTNRLSAFELEVLSKLRRYFNPDLVMNSTREINELSRDAAFVETAERLLLTYSDSLWETAMQCLGHVPVTNEDAVQVLRGTYKLLVPSKPVPRKFTIDHLRELAARQNEGASFSPEGAVKWAEAAEDPELRGIEPDRLETLRYDENFLKALREGILLLAQSNRDEASALWSEFFDEEFPA